MRVLTAAVSEEDAGRLVKYFVRGRMGVSYHQFAALKARDGVRVNGRAVHANHVLQCGDSVEVCLEEGAAAEIAPDPTPVSVVWEDDDILIIDKPAPLACQCSAKQAGMTLENRLAYRYPGMVFRPLNRLDKGTSGLMAAARHAHAAQVLQKQLHTEQLLWVPLSLVPPQVWSEAKRGLPSGACRSSTCSFAGFGSAPFRR